MSLRIRIILAISSMLLVSLAFGAGLSWIHAIRSVRAEMDGALAVGAHMIESQAERVSAAGWRRSDFERVIAAFNGDRHLRASLLDANGSVVAQSSLMPPSDPAPAWFARLLGRDAPGLRIPLPDALRGGVTVILQTDPRNEMTEVWTDVRDTLAIIAIFCALTFPVVFWLLGRALAPLETLSRAFLDIGSNGPSTRVDERGPPELARLARGFNAMVERLALFESRNARLREQLLTIQEEERIELARDLHDEIGPYLFAIRVDAAAIHASLEGGRGSALRNQVRAIEDSVVHVQHQVKAILGRLRSGGLPEFGLSQALANLTAFWRSRHPAIEIGLDSAGAKNGFGAALDAAIYRIVQESLSNAIRHGEPRSVLVRIDGGSGAEVVVNVENDGARFMPGGAGGGLGLRGMAERVTALGGDLSVRDRPRGSGVQVIARLPIHPSNRTIAA
jgi:two-component system sensor histidine kinase UhpB